MEACLVLSCVFFAGYPQFLWPFSKTFRFCFHIARTGAEFLSLALPPAVSCLLLEPQIPLIGQACLLGPWLGVCLAAGDTTELGSVIGCFFCSSEVWLARFLFTPVTPLWKGSSMEGLSAFKVLSRGTEGQAIERLALHSARAHSRDVELVKECRFQAGAQSLSGK